MSLPILDGNQSATTLSTILSGGEHTPAHTVVSLGSTAIANITSAVSGVQIGGTVTANLVGWDGSNLEPFRIGGFSFGADESARLALEVVGVNGGAITASLGGSEVGNGSVVFGVNGADVNAVRSVIYSSANGDFGGDSGAPVDSTNPLPVSVKDIPAISGTVTANAVFPLNFVNQAGTDVGIVPYAVAVGWNENDVSFPIIGNANPLPVQIVQSSYATSITANNPSGALTTRFGSVVTANLATITSAVTNASRKYLLVQNIAASTVTIGIGFSPTTTQGIQLAGGAGLTFDSFCPTGAVYWLSGVTGTNWSVLEG